MEYNEIKDNLYNDVIENGKLNLIIHNHIETYNKKNNFLDDLIMRIVEKGWTYEIMENLYMKSDNDINNKEEHIN